MRIVFMGTPEFAVSSLDNLLRNNFNVVGVVTVPDKPAGRGQKMHQSAVKKYALENNLKLLQPEKLKSESFLQELKDLKADLNVVVAFRMLPEAVWNMPALGTYNLHASLLPRYRGAAPINWAIIRGEKETGVTTFKLKHEIDTGNILFSEKTSIHDDTTAGELHDVLMKKGADLIVKTVKEIESSIREGRELRFHPQDDREASHAPKLVKPMCRVDWNMPVTDIYNLIRGLSPYPTAFSEIQNGPGEKQILKIYRSKFEVMEHNKDNGSLLTDNKNFLKVYCNGGVLEITDLQLEGKKRMPAAEFLRGYTLKEKAILLS
jgi:methionyl-tRNA formyltransferase